MTEQKTPAKKTTDAKSEAPKDDAKPGSKYVVGNDGSSPVQLSGLDSVPSSVLNPAFYMNEDDYAEFEANKGKDDDE